MVKSGRRSGSYRVFASCNSLFMVLLCVVFLYPFLFVIARSLSDGFYILRGQIYLFPRGFTLNAYEVMLGDPRMIQALVFTTQLTIIGTLVNLVLTVLAAYPLSRRSLKGTAIILAGIFISWYFYPGLIPTFLLVKDVGLLDTMWSLILPDAIAPFLLIILMTYIRGIPEELEEAAVVEGCSYWRILTRIVVPISKPVLATLTIFYAVGHWNQYFQALIYISDPDKYTLQLRLQIILDLWSSRLQIVQTAQDYGSLVAEGAQAAAIVIATVPIVLIYPFLQRYFIKGVTLGAIKG